MASERLHCRLLWLGLGLLLMVMGIVVLATVRGVALGVPAGAWSVLSWIGLVVGLAAVVAALLPIERHRADHVMEELFFRSLALVFIILGIVIPICELAKIPSFIDAVVWDYRQYKEAKAGEQPAMARKLKEKYLDDATARAIRLSFIAFLPAGIFMLVASYRSCREPEYG